MKKAKPGDKYLREIRSAKSTSPLRVDVYDVLKAFDVRCPATQHAIKKLLCAGIRGSKSSIEDLREAHYSITRAIEMCPVKAKRKPRNTAKVR